MVYPCNECTRAQENERCGEKKCVDWQRLFLVEWDKFNKYYERFKERQVAEDG